jgi:lysophospholipase L1-like esterase
MARISLLACLFVASGVTQLPSAVAAGPSTPLKQGEVIVFLGDSITQQGAVPKGYVTLIRNSLDKKRGDLGIKVIGAGISGNKVPDLERRLEKDVLARKPTLVVIYIGINDVWHGENDPSRGTSKERYEKGLKAIIGKIQSSGARVILCTPSVIGEKTGGANKLDAKLDEYSAISRKVAHETKSHMCDLRRAFQDYLKTHNAENRESGVLTSDRVHLNEAGNRLVATTIMKCLEK